MRIADLSSFYSPMGGGVRTYTNEKIRHLSKSSDVEYALIRPGKESEVIENDAGKTYVVRGFSVNREASYRQIWDIGEISNLLMKIQPDIVEVGSPYLDPWLAVFSKLRFPHKLVGFYHADVPDTYIAPAISGWPSIARDALIGVSKRYIRFTHNQFDATIVTSPHIHEKLTKLGVENIRLIPLGVDADMFTPNNRDHRLRMQLGVRRGEYLILYAGRFSEEKGIRTLLDATSNILRRGDVHIAFAGKGPLENDVAKICETSPKLHNLSFIESREEMAQIFASSDVFVSPCQHETFGLATLEALSCGLPVVAADRGGARDLVESSQAGRLFVSDDSRDLAEQVDRILRVDFRAMALRSREFASQHLWTNTFEKLNDFYRELADETATGSSFSA